MYRLLSSSALFILLLLGVSANFLREVSAFQQRLNSMQLKNHKNDYFLEPPNCGVVVENSKAPNRIYGGTAVKEGEFPWMVAFSSSCGGTLINSRWVLTAAHCFYGRNYECVKAYLGTPNCKSILNPFEPHRFVVRICEPKAKEFKIERTILHEQYVGHPHYYNDIALVRLKKTVTFSDVVQPICLPYNNQAVDSTIVDNDAIVSGWGTTEYGHAEYLLKATVKIWNADKCIKRSKIREYHICAGGIKGVDTCQGDSGGPLFLQLHASEDHNNNEHYYQVGITSHGKGCAKKNQPGVYTNLTNYIPWIRKTILAFEQNKLSASMDV